MGRHLEEPAVKRPKNSVMVRADLVQAQHDFRSQAE